MVQSGIAIVSILHKKSLVSCKKDVAEVAKLRKALSMKIEIFLNGEFLPDTIGRPGGLLKVLCILGNKYRTGMMEFFTSRNVFKLWSITPS